jgi:hypothetical protein
LNTTVQGALFAALLGVTGGGALFVATELVGDSRENNARAVEVERRLSVLEAMHSGVRNETSSDHVDGDGRHGVHGAPNAGD